MNEILFLKRAIQQKLSTILLRIFPCYSEFPNKTILLYFKVTNTQRQKTYLLKRGDANFWALQTIFCECHTAYLKIPILLQKSIRSSLLFDRSLSALVLKQFT